MKDNERPIGIFDSGLGGLTVYKAVRDLMPGENLIYFGDTARVPYGTKSKRTVVAFSKELSAFLFSKKIKFLIVACNTASSLALAQVRKISKVPVIGVIEPGARAAAAATVNKKILVTGTTATVSSGAYRRALKKLKPGVKVYEKACPLFVPLVEEGWFDHPVTRLTAREYLKPVLAEGIDTLVLGCTHYPLLKPLLQEEAGPQITLIDSAEAMAAITAELLAESGLATPRLKAPDYRFFVTDVPYRFQTIGEHFLARSLPNVQLVKW